MTHHRCDSDLLSNLSPWLGESQTHIAVHNSTSNLLCLSAAPRNKNIDPYWHPATGTPLDFGQARCSAVPIWTRARVSGAQLLLQEPYMLATCSETWTSRTVWPWIASHWVTSSLPCTVVSIETDSRHASVAHIVRLESPRQVCVNRTLYRNYRFIRSSCGNLGDSSVTLAQWWRARQLRNLVICRSPVRFQPKTHQLRFTWISANRPSSKGSKLLFLAIKALSIYIIQQHLTTHTYFFSNLGDINMWLSTQYLVTLATYIFDLVHNISYCMCDFN